MCWGWQKLSAGIAGSPWPFVLCNVPRAEALGWARGRMWGLHWGDVGTKSWKREILVPLSLSPYVRDVVTPALCHHPMALR